MVDEWHLAAERLILRHGSDCLVARMARSPGGRRNTSTRSSTIGITTSTLSMPWWKILSESSLACSLSTISTLGTLGTGCANPRRHSAVPERPGPGGLRRL